MPGRTYSGFPPVISEHSEQRRLPGEAVADALVQLWRGGHGLGRTYWMYGWGVGMVGSFVIAFLEAAAGRSPGVAWRFTLLASAIVLSAYWVVWTVGLCRAAWHYDGPKPAAVLAVIGAVLSWVAGALPLLLL